MRWRSRAPRDQDAALAHDGGANRKYRRGRIGSRLAFRR
jgi:hypothetical protein